MERLQFGTAEVTRVIEWVGHLRPFADVFPDTPPEDLDRNAGWLDPHFLDASTGLWRVAVQTWVVRVDGLTVLIDTGIGNDRDRPQVPQFAHLRTGFLGRLAEAGVDPAEVDVVVNTHIHYDHVGWNTRQIDSEWVPTFPNATYLVPRADYDHFHPDNDSLMAAARSEDEHERLAGARLVFADSIAPVEQAGQLETWDGHHRISDTMALSSTPGHTPGSSVLWLDSGGGAVFVGDLLHSPVQILHADHCCSFDLDPARARVSRRQILQSAATGRATVFPAHFAGAGAAEISPTAAAEHFEIASWAALPPA